MSKKGWETSCASTVRRGAQAVMFGYVDEKKLIQLYYGNPPPIVVDAILG